MGIIPDVISLTRKLLSFNTVNPPGRETPCVRYIGGLLEKGGFKTAYHAFSKDRESLVARLDAGAGRPPICFSGRGVRGAPVCGPYRPGCGRGVLLWHPGQEQVRL